mgnify:CR=1 FL=1
MQAKKLGRPTESKKDTMLRVRLDNKTLLMLDECAEKKQTSRSEIVRNGIKKIHSELKK